MRALVAALLLLAFAAPAARACSCIQPGDPREELADADAAVHGTVTGRKVVRDPSGPKSSGDETIRYRIRVIEDYKGNLGRTVDVRSSASSGSCGIPDRRRGERIGLLLHRQGRRYWSSSCSTRTRAHLEAGRRPLPAPDGTPPARLLVGGGFGAPRVAAFDGQGGVLGFGAGRGAVTHFAVCPGARTVLEAVQSPRWRYRIAVRTVEGLTLRASTPLELTRGYAEIEDVQGIICDAQDGASATVLTTHGRVLRLRRGDVRVVARVRGPSSVAGDAIYTRRRVHDARTGRSRPFGPLPRNLQHLVLSPDGRTLLATRPRDAYLVDAATGGVVAHADRPAFGGVWLGNDTMAVIGDRRIDLLDRKLRRRARIRPPRSYEASAVSERLVVAGDGVLRQYAADGTPAGEATPLSTERVTALASLPAPASARCLRRWPARAARAPAR